MTYKGLGDVALKTFQSSGVAGFYRGLPITVIRDIPSFAAYFGAYEQTKLIFRDSRVRSGLDSSIGPLELMIAGGIAGIAAWLPCYPQDVIKSVIQNDSRKGISTLTYARELLKQSNGSYKCFFKGFSATMARAFPANAATFVAYEFALGLLDTQKEPKPANIVGL
ncbi:hypothetical protein HK098_002236 [Nowakowskiella sp. JEL0407]|nr:hypothetical protein HK098_002236 [Nowakowskiella sp. JEL0407]